MAANAPLTRDRTVSGITEAKIDPMLDVQHHDAEAGQELRAEQHRDHRSWSRAPGGGASGTSASGAVNAKQPAT